jgi:hypothetical protein
VKDNCEFAHTPNPMAALMAQIGALSQLSLPNQQANPLAQLLAMSSLLPALSGGMGGGGGGPPPLAAKKPKLCDFFTNSGTCKKGDTCEYIHQKNKVCEYYSTSKGCKKGKLCDFIHESGDRAERPPPSSESYKKPRMCQFAQTPQGCRKGSSCDFQHPGDEGSSGKVVKESSSSSRYAPY